MTGPPQGVIKELTEIEKAAERIVKEVSNWLNRRVAWRLINAELVLQSLNAYDHEGREAFGPLLSFSTEWKQNRRNQVAKSVDDFVGREVIYRTLQRNLPALRKYVDRRLYMPAARRLAGRRLVAAAGEYEKLMMDVRKTKGGWVWEPGPEVIAISERLRNGQDAPGVIAFAESIYGPMRDNGRRLLDAANDGYGLFADDIVNHHAKLVDLKDLGKDVSGVH